MLARFAYASIVLVMLMLPAQGQAPRTVSVTGKAETLLAKAIDHAKEQAAYLVNEFGAKLGEVQRINSDSLVGQHLSLLLRAPMEADGAAYTPDPIEVSRSVDVVFELVD